MTKQSKQNPILFNDKGDGTFNPSILFSACIVGQLTRYDGNGLSIQLFKDLLDQGKSVAICAEVASGLPIPRPPCEVEPGKSAAEVLDGDAKVISIDGVDFTKEFIDGANQVLQMCLKYKIKTAILRAKSPSWRLWLSLRWEV
ncbi:MAG: DUF523 domain-containing protein [Candidatus Dojkabacteria bacterium]|nr:DUF523 domain-containing protein [Candidatus Dojkabacteria bacterium]